MSAYIQQASVLSGRSMVLAVTIALHVLVISALMAMRIDTGQVVQEVRMLLTVVQDEPRAVEERPPVPRVDEMVPSQVVFDFPTPVIRLPAEETTALVLPVVDGVAGLPAEESVAGPASGTGAGTTAIAATALQFHAVRSTDDYYPSASIQLGEQGSVVVQVCVGPSGQLQGAPGVERSSGSPRLDRAAVRWAGEALRFTPATVDGVPVAACKGFRVNFTLR